MATTFTWTISQLERELSDGFVFTAHYSISASDEAYSAGAYGSIGFERPDTLIPYDNLTQEIVVGWVQEALGDDKVANIEDALQKQIDEKRNPTTGGGLPWAIPVPQVVE